MPNKNFLSEDLDRLLGDEQLLSCPVECAPTYRQYMNSKKINYTEHGIVDGSFVFKLPRRYRPHAWKLHFSA